MAGGRWQVAGPLFPCKFGGFGGGVLFSLQKQNLSGYNGRCGGQCWEIQQERRRQREAGRWGLAVGQAGRGSVCAGCAGGSCAGAAPSPFLSPLPLSLHRLGVNAAWDSFSTTGGGFGGGFWV